MALFDSDNDDDDGSWQKKNHGKIKHAWRWGWSWREDITAVKKKLRGFNGLQEAYLSLGS